jgi:MHS family proline/betaine transporter-like MFS transporter
LNIGVVMAGGSAPYVCTWLVATTGSPIAPAWFLVGTAIITLLTTFTMKETAGTALRS